MKIIESPDTIAGFKTSPDPLTFIIEVAPENLADFFNHKLNSPAPLRLIEGFSVGEITGEFFMFHLSPHGIFLSNSVCQCQSRMSPIAFP